MHGCGLLDTLALTLNLPVALSDSWDVSTANFRTSAFLLYMINIKSLSPEKSVKPYPLVMHTMPKQ